MLPVAAHLSSAQGPHRIVSAVLICQASTCFRMGSKFRCIRSTPTEMQSTSENDFECLASTGVNTLVTMSPIFRCLRSLISYLLLFLNLPFSPPPQQLHSEILV